MHWVVIYVMIALMAFISAWILYTADGYRDPVAITGLGVTSGVYLGLSFVKARALDQKDK